jgi:IS66 Orf2 like protein
MLNSIPTATQFLFLGAGRAGAWRRRPGHWRRALGELIKALPWDGQVLVPYSKWLEKGYFVWPQAKDVTLSLTAVQLSMVCTQRCLRIRSE